MILEYIRFYGIVEDVDDPLKKGRVRVRIHGVHTDNLIDIPIGDLPWAYVGMPNTSPSISGVGSNPFLVRGSFVYGSFIDGNEKQMPIVEGTIHTTPEDEAVISKGFSDSTGEYPRYTKEPDINRLARYEKIEKTIVKRKEDIRFEGNHAANDAGVWDEPRSPYNATYPKNKVFESEYGHVIELDDSPNAERVHIYHRSGSFVEFHPNGNVVFKSVGDNYTLVADDNSVKVNGHCNITVDGNLNVYTKSNANIQADGNVKCSIAGDYDLDVGGNLNVRVDGNIKHDSGGNISNSASGSIKNDSGGSNNITSGGNTDISASKIHLNSSSRSPSSPSDANISTAYDKKDIDAPIPLVVTTEKIENSRGVVVDKPVYIYPNGTIGDVYNDDGDTNPDILSSDDVDGDGEPDTILDENADYNSLSEKYLELINGNDNVKAMLKCIRYAEGTLSSKGYNTQFGYRYFTDMSTKPRDLFPFKDLKGRTKYTSAAGAYQITNTNWDYFQPKLKLPDFTPTSQDIAALYLIDQKRGQLNKVINGDAKGAFTGLKAEWASLPGAGYDQPERKMSDMLSKFESYGGTIRT